MHQPQVIEEGAMSGRRRATRARARTSSAYASQRFRYQSGRQEKLSSRFKKVVLTGKLLNSSL